MTIKDGVESSTAPTNTTATPVSTEDFQEYKSSIDSRFDELKAIILSMQNNTSTSVPPPPTNTTTNVIGFVAASKDPDGPKDAGTEKKPVEADWEPEDFNDDDSFHTTKPKQKWHRTVLGRSRSNIHRYSTCYTSLCKCWKSSYA